MDLAQSVGTTKEFLIKRKKKLLQNNSMRNQLIMGFGLMLLIIAIIVGVNIIQVNSVSELSNRIIELRVPTAKNSSTLLTGIHHALSSLRGWMLLGKEQFKEGRAKAWSEEIHAPLKELKKFSVNWTNPKNVERLKEIEGLFQQFEQAQQEIEDIAQTPENTPSIKMLLEEAAPQAEKMVQLITLIIDLETKEVATPQRKALLGMMADVRGTLGLSLANIRAFLLSGDQQFKTNYEALWVKNERRYKDLQDNAGLLTSEQSQAFTEYSKANRIFEKLPSIMLEMRSQPDWNLANYWLATKAAPIGAKLVKVVDELGIDQKELLDKDGAKIQELVNQLILIEWILLAIGSIFALVFGTIITKSILNKVGGEPIVIRNIAQQVASGDLNIETQATNKNSTGIYAELLLVINSMKKKVQMAEEIAKGNLEIQVDLASDQDNLGKALKTMLTAMQNKAQVADSIAKGNLSIEVELASDRDNLGKALQEMLAGLKKAQKDANTAARIQSAVDSSATSIIMCDRDLTINYVNDATTKMIRENLNIFKETFLGFDLDNLLGTSIDNFHKNPDHQRKLLSDPKNLPYQTDINVGPLIFSLNVSGMFDANGEYIGNNLEWNNVTAERASTDNLKQAIVRVEGGTGELNDATTALTDLTNEMMTQIEKITQETGTVASGAQQMSSNMNSVSAAAEQASSNINSVAVATEEMTNTIGDIANNAEKARDVTLAAVKNVESASGRVDELGLAAKEISKVIEAIVEIAEQTKLLALNATIEAARAGEAGKGFAVVANEVKELAKQTREATADIRLKIENMQSSTDSTVKEIGNINTVINNVNEIVTLIATAVEEQNVTTKDIATNVGQATAGVKEVTGNIVQAAELANDMANNLENVNGSVQGIKGSATDVNDKTGSVGKTSGELQTLVDELKTQ